ncbi:MAG TPA: flagellar biosynthesis protein FlhF, partial [Burkholderiaceae bacterium]
TLKFQDYVRERMLKRRQAELHGEPDPTLNDLPPAPKATVLPANATDMQAARRERARAAMRAMQARPEPRAELQRQIQPTTPKALARPAAQASAPAQTQAPVHRAPPVLREEIRVEPHFDGGSVPTLAERDAGQAQRGQQDMMNELRSMKGLIEQRFGALAFMEKLQRQPARARLTQRLLEVGFSPALVRRLVEGLPADQTNEELWATHVLARNLLTSEAEPALEEQGGVFALIGSTGVGKTTTTAKIAAAFATKYGAAQLGLITLDAYRVGAHEQLRTYGRILGVPVHTAHDRASLEDLLELLAAKKMVLIDTAGTAQRDSRTVELLDMLAHRSIKRLLVLNAAQQGETLEDVIGAWRAADAQGVVLSKIDEAVRLAPALDTLIRHKLKVVGVANGQRVPEDWHRLAAPSLVQRAMKAVAAPAWALDSAEVSLIFAGGSPRADGAQPMSVH